MPRHVAVLLPLTLALVTGCAEVRDTASRATDCVDLARAVASSGLSQLPTAEEAEQAVQQLEEQLNTLDNEDVRSAASTLRDRLREVVDAVRAGDTAAAQRAADDARVAARETAETCGLPVDQFLQ